MGIDIVVYSELLNKTEKKLTFITLNNGLVDTDAAA